MIVFDASTLILLAKADLLERFLAGASTPAAIPYEVFREACEVRQSEDALVIQKLVSDKRIHVLSVTDRMLYETIRTDFGLGTGEAEAIALARQRNASLVATDDRSAINACKLLGIPFTTALAVLVRMCELGVVRRENGLLKLSILQAAGRYRKSMIEAARLQLEVM